MKNKRKWGGTRTGAGRPKTGRTTTHLNVCVPIEYKSLLQDLVKAKIKELKAAQKGLPLPKDFITPKEIAVVNDKGEVSKIKFAPNLSMAVPIKNDRIGKTDRPSKNPESDYLKARRKAKQGLK